MTARRSLELLERSRGAMPRLLSLERELKALPKLSAETRLELMARRANIGQRFRKQRQETSNDRE